MFGTTTENPRVGGSIPPLGTICIHIPVLLHPASHLSGKNIYSSVVMEIALQIMLDRQVGRSH